MRGEDKRFFGNMLVQGGSPPHARGRPDSAAQWADQPRITPACAGKTSAPSSTRRSSRDHPRMRGEDQIPCIPLFDDEGSPPHARGRRRSLWFVLGFGGITPACAGKTLDGVSGGTITADHPRMRGEDRPARPPASANQRITPACAGKTSEAHAQPPDTPDHPRMRGEDFLT